MKQVKTVMLVDDDPIFNIINERMIEVSGFGRRVISYTEPRKALAYLKETISTDLTKFPNAIFLDINMEDMDGWEFLEELQMFPPFILRGCKVFILTSSIDLYDIEKAKTYSMVCDFISKPITIETLHVLLYLQPDAVM